MKLATDYCLFSAFFSSLRKKSNVLFIKKTDYKNKRRSTPNTANFFFGGGWVGVREATPIRFFLIIFRSGCTCKFKDEFDWKYLDCRHGCETPVPSLSSVCLGSDASQSSHSAMWIRSIHIRMEVTRTRLSHDDGRTWRCVCVSLPKRQSLSKFQLFDLCRDVRVQW